jgi:thiamine pyrophosphate-dependent acetolactate synthase large subunit-like protein
MAPVSTSQQHSPNSAKIMNRLDLSMRLRSLLQEQEIVVGGIGNTNFDLFGAGHRPENFYMLGSMGLAVPIGLGLALAQKDRQVFALEGDGSLLMNLGCLSTVAASHPSNLTIIVWDNGLYQITGGQTAATANVTDLVTVARGAGIANSNWAKDEKHFEQLVTEALGSDSPGFIAVRIDNEPSTARPERDPVLLKDRFMRGIGAKPEV